MKSIKIFALFSIFLSLSVPAQAGVINWLSDIKIYKDISAAFKSKNQPKFPAKSIDAIMLEAECTSSAKMKPNGSTKQVINNLTYWSLLGSLPETRVAELSGKVKHAPAEIKKAVAHIKQDHSTYANRSGFFNLPMHVDSQAQCLYWKKGPFKPAEFSCTRTHTSKEIQNALIERSKEQNAAAAHTSYGYIVKNWRINPLHITKLINQKCQAHERYLKNVEKNLFNEMNNF